MNTTKPGPIVLLAGGVVIVIGTILDWGPSTNGLNTDFNGLFGVVALITGVGLAALGAILAFTAKIKLPSDIVGFSIGQAAFAASLTVFLWSFSLIVESSIKVGVHLTWLGAAAAATGSILHMRAEPTDRRSGIGEERP